MRITARTWRRSALVAVPVAASVWVAAAALPASGRDDAGAARDAIVGGKARNVIMLVGDGMGDSEITIARNYAKGANGRLAMDSLPMTGDYTTYAVDKANPQQIAYVTDSAASGTGWSTGYKTYNGAISVTPDGKPVRTIMEMARAAGFKTGDITTSELSDATPAVMASHVTDRGCQGPANMAACPTNDKANGGQGSIVEQLVQSDVDVLMGGGKARFDQTIMAGPYAGQTVINQAQSAGYTVVTDAAGMQNTNKHQKVLGLFAPVNLDLEWTGPLAQPWPSNTTPTACTESNPARSASQPHLSEMATKAINLLDAKAAGNKKGFFLQIEGASIDKQNHAANPCGQIGETVEFDKAVQVALDYAKKHKDTLVVVTADHGHTSQIVEAQTDTRHSPGATTTLLTREGAPMIINYATVSGAPAGSQDHTGTEVGIAAKGPQAYRVLGITNQSDLFTTFTLALNLH